MGWLNDFIFSSPSRILFTFVHMASDGTIFYHIGITLFETFLSFFIVLAAGIFLSILLWWNRTVAAVLEPYLITLNSLPKTALAPIFIVWLGNNMKTIIVCAVSLAIFSTVINLTTSFIQTDPDKLLLIRTWAAATQSPTPSAQRGLVLQSPCICARNKGSISTIGECPIW